MTGLPGSGKSFVLEHFSPVELKDYVTVNADDLKEAIIFEDSPPSIGEEYSGMELSTVVHEESSFMAKQWQSKLQGEGANIALDITGANLNSTSRRIQGLLDAGYTVDVVHVDVGPDEAWTSTLNRYQAGMETELRGRPVPPSFIESMAVDSEVDVIDGHFDTYRVMANGNWWHYKNYPITKQPPELVASNEL
jgi:hypothetical protein